MVALVIIGAGMVCYEATKVWNDDAVIVQQQYLDMSSELNHDAKIILFL